LRALRFVVVFFVIFVGFLFRDFRGAQACRFRNHVNPSTHDGRIGRLLLRYPA